MPLRKFKLISELVWQEKVPSPAAEMDEPTDVKELDFKQWKFGTCDKYKCQVCGKLFALSSAFWQHVEQRHGVPQNRYKTQHPDYLIQTAEIKCELCGNPMKHDFGKMTLHMANVHEGLTLEWYFNRFIRTKVGKEENVGIQNDDVEPFQGRDFTTVRDDGGTTERNTRKVQLKLNRISVDDKSDDSRTPTLEDKEMDVEEGKSQKQQVEKRKLASQSHLNKCRYNCRICDYKSRKLSVILGHFKKQHGMTRQQYYHKYGNPRTVKVIHECRVCGKEILYELRVIKKHAKKMHKRSVKEYFGFGKVAGRISNQEEVRRNKQNNPDLDVKKELFAKKTVLRNTSKPTKFKRNGSDLQYQQSHKITSNISIETWYNGCTFKCDRCENIYYSFESLRRHLGSIHNNLRTNQDKPTFMIKTAHINCKVCGRQLMREARLLISHMHSIHQLTLKEYEQQYHPKLAANEVLTKKELDNVPKPIESCKSNSVSEKMDGCIETWYNGCVVKCEKCGKTYWSFDSMRLHLHKVHCYPKPYNVESLLVKITHINCTVCGAQIMRERGKLRKHMHKKHGLTLKQYEHKHHPKIARNETWSEELGNVLNSRESHKSNSASEKVGVSTEAWYNGCVVKCDTCGNRYWSFTAMRTHLHKVHSYSKPINVASLVIKLTHINCIICGAQLKREKGNLRTHMKKKHGLTLKQYEHKHHPKLAGNEVSTGKENQLKSICKPEAFKKIDSAVTVEEPQEIKSDMPVETWYNGCVFKCDKCDKLFFTTQTMRKHLQNIHHHPKPYNLPSLLIKTTHIKCQICDAKLMREAQLLWRHMLKKTWTDSATV